MLINRNNYETFFLLYADDELHIDERRAVEEFVNENEDLKPELQMIIAAVLPAEEIAFADKSFLYRDIVFDGALQEKLLLKIDDELSATELIKVNDILATNIEAQQEFNILLATKLNAADTIVFEEKHLLYKKEKDNIIVFQFARWAAAAILIGVGLFIGISLFNRNEVPNKSVAVTTPKKTDDNKNITTIKASIENRTAVIKQPESTTKNSTANKNIIKENIASTKKQETEIIYISKNKNNYSPQNNDELIVVNKTPEKQVPLQQIIKKEETVQDIAVLKSTIKNKTVLIEDNIIPLENTYANATSFTDEEKSENKIFYIDEDEVKRSKVGGFFKKVKRLVERTAKIKTGNSISIAGFEIASK